MPNSTLRPISAKQWAIIRKWSAITVDRIERLGGICEWCGLWGRRDDWWNPLEGHHMEPRRHGNHDESNCFVCHRRCHEEIKTIKVFRGIKGIYAEGDNAPDS